VTARLRVTATGGGPIVRSARLSVAAGRTVCRSLARTKRGRAATGRAKIQLRGHDRFGHAITASRTIRLPR
jgi:hypothetical protein